MKSFIIALTILTSTSALAGLNLTCKQDGQGATLIAYGGHSEYCTDKENNLFLVEFEGFGAGVEITGDSLVKINCPFVSKKRIISGTELNVFGPRITAGLIGGVNIGAGLNSRAAFCTVAGLNLSIGASALAGKFTIIYEGKIQE
jgi:hypothetical protein